MIPSECTLSSKNTMARIRLRTRSMLQTWRQANNLRIASRMISVRMLFASIVVFWKNESDTTTTQSHHCAWLIQITSFDGNPLVLYCLFERFELGPQRVDLRLLFAHGLQKEWNQLHVIDTFIRACRSLIGYLS